MRDNNLQIVYIAEDDENIREMVVYALNSTGFKAVGFESGVLFWEALKKETPDLVLLDIMLPGDDGIVILKNIRSSEKYKKIPVIMLTAKGTEYDRIRGLDFGADDYIVKPFSIMETISRIRAVLRRYTIDKETNPVMKAGNISLNYEKRIVFSGENEIMLTFKEFELLYYMMKNRGIVLNRDRLLSQVWGFDYKGESRTVDMHIKSLRQKLGDNGDIITTVRNVGYKIGV